MDLFQQIVLTIAIGFLLIFLLYIAFALRSNKNSAVYPPVTANCPDYWTDQSDGDSSNCVNVMNLGIASESCPKNMNFNTSLFTSTNGLCAKSVWSKNCGLTWDGVTNNDNACTSNSLF
jgi:hypothetical protein